jgi:hypothetical protein
MLKPAVRILMVVAMAALLVAACDVEKQMDTMVDNPSFAEPLFAKFMGRAEYQMKAIDTILADPAMRQVLLDKVASEPEYAKALAEQMVGNAEMREMLGQLMGQSAMSTDSM